MAPTVKRIYRSSSGTREVAEEQSPADVVVLMNNGDQYVASFFPYACIPVLQQLHAASGAFLSGAYFWSKNLVLVSDCSTETLERVVQQILEDGELGVVFERV